MSASTATSTAPSASGNAPPAAVQPPYGPLARELAKGRIVPFLGAGVNYGHRDPPTARWTPRRSSELHRRDLLDVPGLVRRLSADDATAAQLRGKLSEATREALPRASAEELAPLLLDDLNALIRTAYDTDFLTAVGLPESLRRTLAVEGEELQEANRQILSDMLPGYLRAWQASPEFLPSGAELSRFLAGQAHLPSEDKSDVENLAKTASYFVETTGRRQVLREYLHALLDRDYPPCPIHHYLAELSSQVPRGTPLVIVTTNYDDLLERAFDEFEQYEGTHGRTTRAYDVVVHATEDLGNAASVLFWAHGADRPTHYLPSDLPLDLENRTVIYKMHGSVVRAWRQRNAHPGADRPDDSYVITEEDYVNFLVRMANQTPIPPLLHKHFRRNPFLFLGYGLGDWNLRVLLESLKKFPRAAASVDGVAAGVAKPGPDGGAAADAPDQPPPNAASWAIQVRPTALERELWARRQVLIYDVDINEFVHQLRRTQRQAEGIFQ